MVMKGVLVNKIIIITVGDERDILAGLQVVNAG
jgi:hypothetical protein